MSPPAHCTDILTDGMVFDVLVGRQTTVICPSPSFPPSSLPLSVVSITSLDGSTDERRADGHELRPRPRRG